MRKIRFTHKIMVPNNKTQVHDSDGYAEEMADVKIFELTQEEYEELRKDGGLFDLFDNAFDTIIDDCEEDRITDDKVGLAISLTNQFIKDNVTNRSSGVEKVRQSLEYANNIGVFWEIVNGVELYE